MSSCCPPPKPEPTEQIASSNGCCGEPSQSKGFNFDLLLWGSFALILVFYALYLGLIQYWTHSPVWVDTFAGSVFELVNTMWWSVLLAFVFVGLMGQIPQQFVVAILGKGGTFKGIWRATLAGVLMDLCSHGILMVGMQLYRRGASLGQVMAFLIASPWNSLSLTLILIALIGLPWTLAFILLSIVIALISGWIFERLTDRGVLPANPNTCDLPEDFQFMQEAKTGLKGFQFNGSFITETLKEGAAGSRMVLRWLLFGILLASAVRTFVPMDAYQTLFGATLAGLGLTLLAATLIEVCSEGLAPLAADLLTRANAPGNSFTFMMAGVATDYTEVMSIRDTTGSWKIALYLPLVTIPQVLVVAVLLNQFPSV